MSLRDKFIEISQSQVGYTEGNNNYTKYADYFDKEAWQYFNGKKQNVAWCSTYVHWLFCQLGVSSDKIRSFLGEPAPKDNCACGVSFFANYLKALGWKVGNNEGQSGDIITFKNNDHVGHIEKVDNGRYYTIEGNKNNKVSRCDYAIGDSAITCIFRPDWNKLESLAGNQSAPVEPVKEGYPGEWPTLPKRGYFQKGDKGADVKKLQKVIKWIDPSLLPKYGVDGSLGAETVNGVKSCQKILGVAVDGLWGKKSQAAAQAYKK